MCSNTIPSYSTFKGEMLVSSEDWTALNPKSDAIRAVVLTRFFKMEGLLHFPRMGKESRRLSNMLNKDRKFLAMTEVSVVQRSQENFEVLDHNPARKTYPLIQVNVGSIEFIQPIE
jgi:hypothetical protein